MSKNKHVLGLFFAVSAAFFVWLSWKQLSVWIGDDVKVWAVAGIIVLLGWRLGYIDTKKLGKKFGV